MKEIIIYQTVANRGNKTELEQTGPILCTYNPWLGEGYYFWDTLLDNAIWWGENHYQGNYMIFQSSYDLHAESLFDLWGNIEHINYLKNISDKLKYRLGISTIKVARIISFMQKEGLFPFEAVRAEGIPYKSNYSNADIYFEEKRYYLKTNPKVQICILDFKSFSLSPFTFVKEEMNVAEGYI